MYATECVQTQKTAQMEGAGSRDTSRIIAWAGALLSPLETLFKFNLGNSGPTTIQSKSPLDELVVRPGTNGMDGYDAREEEKHVETCKEWIHELVTTDPKIIAIVDAINRVLPKETPLVVDPLLPEAKTHVHCVTCSSPSVGAVFLPPSGVTICANNIVKHGDKTTLQHTFTHELIHAFDFTVAQFDLANVYHVAYSEIRAAALSNECYLKPEPPLPFHTILNGAAFEHCVKRRAALAIASNSDFGRYSKQEVDAVVKLLYPSAIKDSSPFDSFKEKNLF